MKSLFFLLVASSFLCQLHSQIPDNSNGRLWRLCKVWGYLKYHHPNKCNITWRDLLLKRIDSVKNSSTNAEFNTILYNMCLEAGIANKPNFPMNTTDSSKNYNIQWFADPYFNSTLRNYLDSIHAYRILDSSKCLVKDGYWDPNHSSYLDFRADKIDNIPGFNYSNLNHRILVYFHYWNIINYFFPQINLADIPWDQTLYELMDEIISAKDLNTATISLSKVVARIDDSHGFFYSVAYSKFIREFSVSYALCKLSLARIENKCVVINSGIPGVQKGDIITHIDNVSLDTIFKRKKDYISASNEITKYRNLYSILLCGPYNTTKSFTIIDSTGVSKNVPIKFTMGNDYNTWLDSVDTMPIFKHLDCNIGYVHMGKIKPNEVAEVYNDLKNTDAIIFDIRNYPNGTLWDFKPLLFPSPNQSAIYFRPTVQLPGYYSINSDTNNFGTWSNPKHYKGKIRILVNEQTQSQAEYTAQTLRTHPGAKIFGSQTAGADGNVAFIDLPGGIKTYWSSLGWYQGDWYNPQRAGVKIDTIVKPTIVGIRRGIDEVLLRASKCIQKPIDTIKPKDTIKNNQITSISDDIYKLSFFDNLYLVKSLDKKDFSIRVFTVDGKEVRNNSSKDSIVTVDLTQFSNGLYILQIIEDGIVKKVFKIVQ